MKDEPVVVNREISAAYRERLQYMNEKLMALMMAVDTVILGGPTEGLREAIETKLGEFCYTLELGLAVGDISPYNVAISTGLESREVVKRLKHQPMAALSHLEKALNQQPATEDVDDDQQASH